MILLFSDPLYLSLELPVEFHASTSSFSASTLFVYSSFPSTCSLKIPSSFATAVSRVSSLFTLYLCKLLNSLPMHYSTLVKHLPPSFLLMYILCTFDLGWMAWYALIILRVCLSNSRVSFFVHRMNAALYRITATAHELIAKKRFRPLSFVLSRSLIYIVSSSRHL